MSSRQVALPGADVSRHIWPEGSLGNTSCLPGGLQDKVPRVSPHPSTAGQPSGLPCFLLWGIKGSAWLTLAGLLPSLSPNQRSQG